MSRTAKNDLIRQLQKEVLSLQGFKRSSGSHSIKTGLHTLEAAFPNHCFPTGVVHEFISHSSEDATATNGFIAGLLHALLKKKGACIWIAAKRTVFPPALKMFGINPERVIFIDCNKQKEVLWAIEEALKCEALTAVVSELPDLTFKESRRLQLAVEQTSVTGFIHRCKPKTENTVACVTRWKIKPLPSELEEGMPGLGLPRWQVQLVKVRNGRPDSWEIEWNGGKFRYADKERYAIPQVHISKAI